MRTPQDLDALLTGAAVRLWPYAPGLFPRDVVYHVWQAMEREHAWAKLFWWQPGPVHARGDLCSFAAYLRERTVLLVEARTSDTPWTPVLQRLCGLIWFDEVQPGLRANISIWFARAAWGRPAQEAGEIATRYAHQALRLPALWGVTPWRQARAYAARCGYRPVATLPHYVRIAGQPRAMHYLVHEDPGDGA